VPADRPEDEVGLAAGGVGSTSARLPPPTVPNRRGGMHPAVATDPRFRPQGRDGELFEWPDRLDVPAGQLPYRSPGPGQRGWGGSPATGPGEPLAAPGVSDRILGVVSRPRCLLKEGLTALFEAPPIPVMDGRLFGSIVS
jgi:hypothetical protein